MRTRNCWLLVLGVSGAFLLVAAEPAAAKVRVDVTYTSGEILDGPLSFGLAELPESVTTTMIFDGPFASREFGPEDVLSIDLDFGDAHFTETDLHPLTIDMAVLATDLGGLVASFSTLSYRLGGGDPTLATYAPLQAVSPGATVDPCASPTATVACRLAANSDFALNIFGQDVGGDFLHYQYSTSEQIGVEIADVPEPSTLALCVLGFGMACAIWRHGRCAC